MSSQDSAAAAMSLLRDDAIEAAEAMLQRLLAGSPRDPMALHVMSLLLLRRGEADKDKNRDKALAFALAATEAAPAHPGLHYALANLLHDAGRAAEAVPVFAEAVRLKPDFFEAWNNLGLAAQDCGDLSGAEQALRHALSIRPDSTGALANLASVLRQVQRPAEAFDCLRAALLKNPAHDEYRQALADVGDQLVRADALENRTDLAIARYRQLLELNPHDWRARIGMRLALPVIHASAAAQAAARMRYAAGLETLCAEATPEALASLSPEDCLRAVERDNFVLAYQGEDDRALQARYSGLLGRFLQRALPRFRQPLPRLPVLGRPVRIGFASCFFRECTVGHYFAAWITDLPAAHFSRFVYVLGGVEDAFTDAICQGASRRVRLDGSLSDAAAAIRADALDILVFPELGMNGRTYALAGLRLAPVQCAAWGHPVTSGHSSVDYYFSSALMEPLAADSHYTEKLIRLPGLGTRYRRPPSGPRRTRQDFGLPDAAHLYFFPHALFKIHPENDALVARILAADPAGLLVLCAGETGGMTKAFMERLQGVLAAHGVAPERCRLMPYMPRADYLTLNGLCNVMLDPTRWSGGNTTLDALACGLPVVTRRGHFMRGRQTAGLLQMMDCAESIASDDEAYCSLALRLGTDSAWRAHLSNKLQARVGAVFDDAKPVRALADALLAMVSGKP